MRLSQPFLVPCTSLPLMRRCILGFVSLGIVAVIPLSYPSPAQAGIFDFLFGRRRGASSARGRRSGGAVRDECPVNTSDGEFVDFSSFQALAPGDNQIVTGSTHPTFWFNLPFSASDQLKHVEFMLIHQNDKTYALDAPILFHLPSEPGIVQLQLPETTKGLERDRTYQWFFSIQCDSVELSRNPVLTGLIVHPSVVPSDQPYWPEALLESPDLDRSSSDWQELENAPELQTVDGSV